MRRRCRNGRIRLLKPRQAYRKLTDRYLLKLDSDDNIVLDTCFKNSNANNHSLTLQETQIEQLKSRRQEILDKCELEHISLPMETGSSAVGPVFDFSQLNRSLLQDKRPSEREKIEVDFKQKMDALISEIERTAPNLKALDQYEALLKKERAVTEEFEAARKEEKEKADKFNSVKEERYYLS